MNQMRYTIKDLREDFPDERACLIWLKENLYPDGIICKNCKEVTPHHLMNTRKSFSCELCGHHVHPTVGTIFENSSTPLTYWFHAIYIMGATRAGISAKQLEREIGVTYKTAFRMFHKIRSMMSEDSKMTGEVEIDETYLSPNPMKRRKGKTQPKAQIIFGATERGGRVRVKHIQKAGKHLIAEVNDTVSKDATLYSDSYQAYKLLHKTYNHRMVKHMEGEYVKGVIHTQNIENFWSNMKRGITGVYRHVSPKYLQAYADEYAFRYSHRNDYQPMFWAIMNQIIK